MIDKSTKELERALNPREWDKELNEAWHKNIPDLQKAFDAIKNIAIKRAEDKMKHTIEIEGLPNNVAPIALRKPKSNKEYIFCLDTGCIVQADHRIPKVQLIVKKKQPRRIVLEETGEIRSNLKLNCYNYFYVDSEGFDKIKIFREIKENDSSLTNEEPKLSLTVDELKSLLDTIDINVVRKIQQFLKDK